MITITRLQFRYLLGAQISFFILLTTLPFVMGAFLSPEARAIYDYLPEEISLSPVAIGLSIVLIPVAFWSLQNLYALFTFKPYAPKHLLIITAIGLTAGVLIDPLGVYQYTGVESMVVNLYAMTQGIVLALVFTSNLADEFRGRAPAEDESTLPATQS